MNHKTEKSFKLKSGEIVSAGLPVTFDSSQNTICFVHGAGETPYKIRITSAFVPPSMEELEEQVNDGVCDSILGEQVEPDGTDEYGSPSWLLALGMI